MPRSSLELAEDYTYHLQPRAGFLRVVRDEWVLTTGTSGAMVTRVRLAASGVAGAVEAIRALLVGEDVDRATWWCGTLARPRDLPERLAALGLVPDDEAPTLQAMALEREPGGTPTADVRRVASFDEFTLAMELDWVSCGAPADLRERRRARLPETWASAEAQGAAYYLGYLDGEPAGFARAFVLDDAVLLQGGSTLPSVRGRGVYVSLVHARWRDAVERGTPTLVVQAGAMSEPILARLGFEHLGEIRLLVDRL